MNLLDALKSNRPIKRKHWDNWMQFTPTGGLFLKIDDLIGEDWEVKVDLGVRCFHRDSLDSALLAAYQLGVEMEHGSNTTTLQHISTQLWDHGVEPL